VTSEDSVGPRCSTGFRRFSGLSAVDVGGRAGRTAAPGAGHRAALRSEPCRVMPARGTA